MKIWTYIEAHHDELGVGLFIIPVCALGLVIAGVAYGLTVLVLR
jgi:hypothetical protein